MASIFNQLDAWLETADDSVPLNAPVSHAENAQAMARGSIETFRIHLEEAQPAVSEEMIQGLNGFLNVANKNIDEGKITDGEATLITQYLDQMHQALWGVSLSGMPLSMSLQGDRGAVEQHEPMHSIEERLNDMEHSQTISRIFSAASMIYNFGDPIINAIGSIFGEITSMESPPLNGSDGIIETIASDIYIIDSF
ncbi:hypothetical protein WI697_26360 [Tistrella mobilis]|uniref:hypothetical protein n=1 Tax=Tistrella mobilis TaxID=171437 RepID=UPI0031F616D1